MGALAEAASSNDAASKALAEATAVKIAALNKEIEDLKEKEVELEALRSDFVTLTTKFDEHSAHAEEKELSLISEKDAMEAKLKEEIEETRNTLRKEKEEMESNLRKEKDEVESSLRREREEI